MRTPTFVQTPTRVLSAEHLVAICVQTGRDKDRQRVRLFVDEGELDTARLDAVLARHGLSEKWTQWTS